MRYARRLLRPFTPLELSLHLRLSERRTRDVLRSLLERNLLNVASGDLRYRTYKLAQS
ncbi:hypothetical protein D1872_289740 [compost metagenome]